MTALAPERSLAQRMTALQHANEIRSRRAEVKRDITAGRVLLRDLLADPPELLLTAKVLDLMLASPKIGPIKASRLLRLARVSPSKTVGGVSARQRAALIALLPARRVAPAAPGAGVKDTSPDAQHMRALGNANGTRLARAALKERIAAGDVQVADVIANVPPDARSMTIGSLLAAQHRWGDQRTRRFLARLGIAEDKRLGWLTRRQREALIAAHFGAVVSDPHRPIVAVAPPSPAPRPQPAQRARPIALPIVHYSTGRLHLRAEGTHGRALCNAYSPRGWIPAVPGEWHEQGAPTCGTCTERAAEGGFLVDP